MTLICHQALTDHYPSCPFNLHMQLSLVNDWIYTHMAWMVSSTLQKFGYIVKACFCTAFGIYSNDMKQIQVVLGVHISLQNFEAILLKESRHFQLTVCPISSALADKALMHKNYPYIGIASENASRLIYGMKRIVILWAQKWKTLLCLQREYCKITYTLVRRKEKL